MHEQQQKTEMGTEACRRGVKEGHTCSVTATALSAAYAGNNSATSSLDGRTERRAERGKRGRWHGGPEAAEDGRPQRQNIA
eukprot:4774455-Pyramimonas_sp.AAC.1